ncbi:hypothetical protein F4777DRAFT_395404 [Nemania sp. FL0916]|nr:hypothetical protein F4777DRAFT_395404 [Nemania sp. FL0916]
MALLPLPRMLRPLRHVRSSFTSTQGSHRSVRPASSFQPGSGPAPSPPRLPASEQAEFERLQRLANTSMNTQDGLAATSLHDASTSSPAAPAAEAAVPLTSADPSRAADGADSVDNVSMPLRKGAPPEFEGDVNPRTGEVGGPKNEPLRWGANGDYSYNGRVTDF